MNMQKEQPTDETWLKHIAGLACIDLTEAEIRRYTAELNRLLLALDGMKAFGDSAEGLTDGIPESELREDTVGSCLPREELLSASASADGVYYLISHGRELWGGAV